MKNKSKFKKIILGVIIVLVLIFAGLFVAFKIYTGNYYDADNTVISELADDLSEEVHTFTAPEGMVFLPQNQEYRAVIVFIPEQRLSTRLTVALCIDLLRGGTYVFCLKWQTMWHS